MDRRTHFLRAAELARAASDNLTIASCGVTPAKRLILQEEAEAALYAAIDLIWQSGEVVTLAVPANGSDDDTPPPAASSAIPHPQQLEQAA